MAMEPNNSRIHGKFLSNVIYRALPSALSDLVLTIGVVLFCIVFQIPETEMSTICTVVVGVVGLLMVYRTCKPFNTLRKLLMIVCVVGFLICITALQPIFTLNLNLSAGGWLVLAVFVLLAFEVSPVRQRHCGRRQSGGALGAKKAAPAVRALSTVKLISCPCAAWAAHVVGRPNF